MISKNKSICSLYSDNYTQIKLNLFIGLLFSLLAFFPFVANAGVTVFDESTGKDVDATLEGGNLEKLQRLQIQSIPRKDEPVRAVKEQKKSTVKEREPRSPSDIVLEPWDVEIYDLGHAQIFVDGGKFSDELSKNVKKIKNIEGLRVDFYLKEQEDFSEIIFFTRNGLLKMGTGVKFRTDSRNEHFKSLGMRNHMSVHYTSPFGDSREFPLDNPQYLINKINDVRSRVRNQ